jgi:hypothetical protein
MLNFGGVDMMVDASNEATICIRTYMTVPFYTPWRGQSWPGLGTAGLKYPTGNYVEPPYQLNRRIWSCGGNNDGLSRWAYMHLLVCSDDVQALIPYTCEQGSYLPSVLKLGNPETGGESLEIPSMFMLPPTPLSGTRGIVGGLQSLYLITLVDLRYFLQFTNTGDLTTFLGDGTAITWSSLYDFLIAEANLQGIPFDLNFDPIPEEYLQPSVQMWNLPYEPLPRVLDGVAFNVEQRITALFNGTFYAMNATTAVDTYVEDAVNNPQRNILAGGFRYNDPL